MKTISILGLGYIGLPTAMLLASKGNNVFGFDINENLIKKLKKNKINIKEKKIQKLYNSKKVKKNFKVYSSLKISDIYLITTPTPIQKNKKANLNYVTKAIKEIAKLLKKGDMILLESTCPIGTSKYFCKMLLKLRKDLINPINNLFKTPDFNFAYCPERVLPGNILYELVNNDRLIGGVTKNCQKKAEFFYKKITKGKCVLTDTQTAEMCKLAENSYRDVNIAFANELKSIAAKNSINVWDIVKYSNLHPRVNIHKPGPGVGGHCIAVDPWFLIQSNNQRYSLIRNARKLNDSIPSKIVKNIVSINKHNKNISVCCLGITYKANVDDIRESPAITIINSLINYDFKKIYVCDPNINFKKNIIFKSNKIIYTNLKKSIDQSSIIVLLVDHKEFFKIKKSQIKNKIVIDTRGIFNQ